MAVFGHVHVDRCLVQLTEQVRANHVVQRAAHHLAIENEDDAVEQFEQRIEVMRHEYHRHVAIEANGVHQVDDLVLTLQIKAGQRFVEQQQPWIGQQRLRDEQALLLTT